METNLLDQALSLLCFALLGLGLGLLYDLLRPLRYAGKHAFLWDGSFCAAAAAGIFFLSMGSGRLGLWDITAALLSFCLYINLLSALILPGILGISKTMHNCYENIVLYAKKLQEKAKKFFTNCSD